MMRCLPALVLVCSACANTVRVPVVDYSFRTPLVTTVLGLPAAADGREAFARVFCETLWRTDRAEGWRECGEYLDLSTLNVSPAPLPPLVEKYKVVVVAGIFSACLPPGVTIYRQGIDHLKQEYVDIEEIKVSASGGTGVNAKLIADYIRAHRDEKHKFIAVGYSQGVADLLEAYAADDVVRDSVDALITVAGAVSGSRLADGIPSTIVRFLDTIDLKLPGCEIKSLKGIDSLRRSVRYDFLSANRARLPRAYSIAGKSTREKTSRILQGGWDSLKGYSIDQDSQVIRDEATVPGGTFLGTALGDHWAVALPFREEHSALWDNLVNWNVYPRTALLEAAVRFVMADLTELPR